MTRLTKKAIMDTFVSMVERRCIDEITVSDLARECEINRNTFYYHYADIYAVLDEVFQYQTERSEKSLKRGEFEADFYEALLLISQHKGFVNHIYFSNARDIFLTHLSLATGMITQMHFGEYYKQQGLSEDKQAFSTKIISLVLRSFIIEWIRNGYTVPVNEFAHTTAVIFSSTIENTLDTIKNKI